MKHRAINRTLSSYFRLATRAVLGVMLVVVVNTQVFAQPVNLTLTPSVSSVAVGQNFTVTVAVDFTAAGSFNILETYINFNPLDLEVIGTPTIAPGVPTLLPIESVPMTVNNTTGRVDYGRFNNGAPGTYPNADFAFITITFQAERVGTANITFNTVPLRQTVALNNSTSVLNQAIATSVNMTPAGCTLTAAQLSNTPTCDASGFNLILQSVTGGTAPYDLVINGTTYNDINPASVITAVTPASINLFGNGAPNSLDEPDGSVTLGMKFRSSVSGYIRGIRFFTHAVPSGLYSVQLWSGGGSLITSGTFGSVTGNAWNEFIFTTPVPIAANTTYVASYFTEDGFYTSSNDLNGQPGFTSAITNGPLTGLADTPGDLPTGNGVYSYGGAPTFPTDNFHNTNYWVDVLFVPDSYSFALTSVTDFAGCQILGSPIQNLVVSSPTCASLPVTLVDLSATPENNNILVSWSTASEFDNKGFDVQRSSDKALWENLTFVPGAGNSSSLLHYSYTDRNLLSGTYYYRIKQIDIDGKFTYSNIVSATIGGQAKYELGQNFPNPFKGETSIRYSLPQTSKVTLTLFDVNGRSMSTLVNATKAAGMHLQKFYPGALPPGVYYYKLQAGSFTAVKKLVIQ